MRDDFGIKAQNYLESPRCDNILHGTIKNQLTSVSFEEERSHADTQQRHSRDNLNLHLRQYRFHK